MLDVLLTCVAEAGIICTKSWSDFRHRRNLQHCTCIRRRPDIQ